MPNATPPVAEKRPRRQIELSEEGRRLLDARLEAGERQEAIALAVGLTESGLSRIRGGSRGASYLVAMRLAQYLGVPFSRLWEGPAVEFVPS